MQTTMSVQEYLTQERTSPVKHEYVEGHVYAMAGGTLAHDIVANTVRAILRNHLRGRPCRLLGPDVLLRVSAEVYYYPDALVVCEDTLDLTTSEVQTARLVVEVLSDSTEAHDRGTKFKSYQTLPGCQEYLLIDGRRCGVERFHRGEQHLWVYQHYTSGETITLDTIGLTCPIADFYEDAGM